MRTGYFLFFLLWLPALAISQEREKLKDFTFKAHSTAFADANQYYSEQSGDYLYLSDSIILDQLYRILVGHPSLVVEIGGHCDAREDTLLAGQRAALIIREMVAKGIDNDRLQSRSYASRSPLIKPEILHTMETQEEQEAAHQKNRRVNIKVIRTDYSAETTK